MTEATRIADLLDGPRGRRMCLSLITSAHPELWTSAFYAEQDEKKIPALAEAVAAAGVTEAAAAGPEVAEAPVSIDEATLLDALAVATDSAMYWQPADETDVMLRDEGLRAALEPTARRVATSRAADWLWSPLAWDEQRYVQWMDGSIIQPPVLTGAADRLRAWREKVREGEARAVELPADVTARYSGSWWSIPVFADLAVTTRALSGLGATKLRLVEDGLGWGEALVVPLRPRAGARVFEITGPTAWAELVDRYPLDITLSRRHDWWNVSGMDVRWMIPDWSAVASDFDAVHLTVAGYLSTAGRALPITNGFTMLAGWSPDETYWLGDVLEPAGESTWWSRDMRVGGPWRQTEPS
jgi:hypothetical protein